MPNTQANKTKTGSVKNPFPIDNYKGVDVFGTDDDAIFALDATDSRTAADKVQDEEKGVFELTLDLTTCDPKLAAAVYVLKDDNINVPALEIFNDPIYTHLQPVRAKQWELDTQERKELGTYVTQYNHEMQLWHDYHADRRRLRELVEEFSDVGVRKSFCV